MHCILHGMKSVRFDFDKKKITKREKGLWSFSFSFFLSVFRVQALMASIACTIHLSHPTTTNIINCSGFSSSSSLSVHRLSCSKFLGNRKQLEWMRDSRIGPNNNAFRRNGPSSNNGGGVGRIYAWFKFGKNGVDAEGAGIYGSQSREDYDRDDVEQYFNYMGMLAVEGTYDKMNSLLNQNIHPADILLLMAASEGDKPKIEELLRAGAKYNVKDVDGKTALERAPSDEIKDFIIGFSAQKA